MSRTKPWIERLTPEQEALLPKWREEWFKVGTRTDPADKPRAERAITAMYARIGKSAPRFLWADSPMTAHLLMHLLQSPAVASSHVRLGENLEHQLRASLGDSMGDPLWASLGDSMGDPLWDSLWDSLGGSLVASLRASLWASLGASLRTSLRTSLWDSLWDSKIKLVGTDLWGQQDSYWIAFYRFCQEIGVQFPPEETDKLKMHEDVARSCMWFWSFERTCIVSNRPSVVHFDSFTRPRLHNVSGPAVMFRDGWGVWAWHGVRVPQAVIESPITLPQIAAEKNAEIRRVLLERYGVAKYVQDSGAKELHRDRYGKLYAIPMESGRPIKVVQVKNSTPEPDGTIKDYWLRCHPGAETAHAAVASLHWRGGRPMTAAEYHPGVET